MKKTIIASAIAAVVAAPAAFADVSISGQANMEFSNGFGGTTERGLNADQNVDLVFTASEDLGNGMKAGVKIAMNIDNNTNNNSVGTAANATNNPAGEDLIVSLSGDFGTIAMGNMESFTEGKLSAMMALDPVDSISIEDGRDETKRTEGGIAYVSPSFNGLTVGVAGFAGLNGATGQNGDLDATDMYVSYSNSGLTVSASHENVDAGGATTAKDKKTTMVGAQYKMGDLTLRVVDRDVDMGAAASDSSSLYYGASYTMGANTVAVEAINEKGNGAVDAKVISLKHALSKNTAVYVGVKNSDSAVEDQTTVGMQVKF
jgi:predicted porin